MGENDATDAADTEKDARPDAVRPDLTEEEANPADPTDPTDPTENTSVEPTEEAAPACWAGEFNV